jgi:metallo-beta-lactamase class B
MKKIACFSSGAGAFAAAALAIWSGGSTPLAQAQTEVPANPQPRPPRPAVSAFAKPVDYPNANAAAVSAHFNKARVIAGDDLYIFFDTLCIQDQVYKQRTQGAQYDGIVPAQQVFDNLYYVGQMSVGAWAIKTSAGLILIDSLDNQDEAQHIIEPGLIKMGWQPRDIKYVVITHSHGDHFGGAQYFKDTYGSILVASPEDWEVMAHANPAQFGPAPRRGRDDLAVGDGGTLSLGGETLHFGLTPAHTPGTLSLYFRVTDHGVAHTAGLYGGIGMPRTDELKELQIRSMTHWMEMTKAASVDAQIGNHPLHFDGPARLEELMYRVPGQPNPFVLGVHNYQRYMDLQRECVKLSLARDGIAQ